VGISLGELLGPLVAGILANNYSYERTFSVLAWFIIAIGFLYFPLVFHDYSKKT
jgi:dipeptide/tripeptide permease